MSGINEYFASKPAKELAAHLEDKLDQWQEHCHKNGLFEKWRQSFNTYYGEHFKISSTSSGGSIPSIGNQGEKKLLKINHYRNLIRHILIMTTSQRPAWDAKAINADPKSLSQARLGNSILETYLKEKRLGRFFKKAGEYALVLGKGFLKMNWEPSLGRPYGRVSVLDEQGQPKLDDEGQPFTKIQYEGDAKASCHGPTDVFHDPAIEDWQDAEWVDVRLFKNRFNLVARHPDIEADILKLPTKHDLERKFWFQFQSTEDSDSVEVHEFYHRKTEALPNGRYMLWGRGGVVLYDGPYPYGEKRLPVFRIVPGDILGTAEGYTEAFDLLPLQEAINTLASIIFSNQNATGLQTILYPDGCNLTPQQLAEGLLGLKYDPNKGKPETLQLTNTPAEIFKFLELLERFSETISGMNSVARGNPDSSLKSGVALGLVQSMAIQYASGFQESWVELLEDSGTFLLCDLIRPFAKTKRIAATVGKMNRGQLTEYMGKDMDGVDRVTVELGNAMSRTTAGRVAIADNLLEKGLIKTPQEYITVMNTGQLEPALQMTESELSLIHQENDDLLEGRPVQGLAFDSHLLHMQEHRVLFANPEVRKKPEILEKALAHWQWHKETYQSQDPILAMVAGEPPAPPMMPPPPMPMDPGAPMPMGGAPIEEQVPPLPPGVAPPPPPGALPGAPGILPI